MSLHLQQAEEDRNIVWQLVERLMATINIENDDIESQNFNGRKVVCYRRSRSTGDGSEFHDKENCRKSS